MRIASVTEVRSAIAAHMLGCDNEESVLGEIALHPHQRDGVALVRLLLDRHGGALLADDVGLGKTFVALAVARDAGNVLVLAPAAVRDAWFEASRRANVVIRFVSVEAMGRRDASVGDPDFVIVDEAHHLRNATTRRFATASALCRRAKVLLLSATPVQNRLADLRTILSLFLGSGAHALSADELARFVVRRAASDVAGPALLSLPSVADAQWLEPVADIDCLDRLVALPRALPPSDGDDGGVLLTYTLMRQWSSSRAALRSALQRRLARAHAMEDALLAGRLPSRAELAAWCFAEGAQQLAFPELAATCEVEHGTALLHQVRHHATAVRALVTWLDSSPDPDSSRAAQLQRVMRRHSGERIVAFSEYADTVAALYRSLASAGRVAMLTHAGGRVAGGPLGRREVLERFGPGASSRMPASERIDLLLTTDVLSEGVNLQDASVVVHLDLSWNPARMQQRVGRLRRLGAARESIGVYMFAPPAPAERLLRLEQRLRLKLGTAARTVGLAGAILPGMALSNASDAAAPREERIAAALRRWRTDGGVPRNPVAAATRSSISGALACVQSDHGVSLVAIVDGRVLESRAMIERLVDAAGDFDLEIGAAELRTCQEAVERWFRHRLVSDVVDLPALRVARSRRTLLRRVDAISRRAARHAQPQLAPLMRAARSAATAALSAGAERVLDELAASQMSDEAWLQAIGEFAALHARSRSDTPPRLLALLILRTA
jgi:hypothetical protein